MSEITYFQLNAEICSQFLESIGVCKNKLTTRKWNNALRTVMSQVRWFVDRYGTDGHGNQPPEMDITEYWISHISDFTPYQKYITK